MMIDIKNILRNKRMVLIVFAIGISTGFIIGIATKSGTAVPESQSSHEHSETSETQQWTCSMHPQIRQDKSGSCPICGMDLIPMTTMNASGDDVDPNEIQLSDVALALADVQTTTVKKGVPEKNVHLLGKIKADERNISELTARFGGRIEKLLVNYTGQQVHQGQKLGTIYSPELITAQRELLEAIKFKETNPSFYRASRTKLKLWDLTDAQIDTIETQGEPKIFFDILSPITGTVTKRHITIGDYIKEGSALFEVVDLTKVWVMFDAYESDLPWIKTGDIIDFTLQSVPGKQYEGKVTYIDPFIDATTRIAQVRVELNNPKLVLKPEMFANGILISKIAENVNEVLIPKSSILWTGKRAVVYIKVGGRETTAFRYREVTLGPEAGNFYVVQQGLQEGEEIAINGVFKIDAAAQLAGKQSMMNPIGEQVETSHEQQSAQPVLESNVVHAEFRVAGNCGMCKNTIETSATELAGINHAEWNEQSKIFHVTYNKDKVTLDAIHKAIAKSGYDTEKESAPTEVYQNLPACCKYKD